MTIKFKLIIITSISILLISFLSLYTIIGSFLEYKNAENIKKVVFISDKIASLVHEIEKERGFSSRYLFFTDENIKIKMSKTRIIVDKKIIELKRSIKNEDILNSLEYISNKLKKERINIDSSISEISITIDLYTEIVDKLLHHLVYLSKLSNNVKVTNKIIAYYNLLYLKNYIGIERALVSIVSAWSYSHKFTDKIKENSAVLEIYKKNFESYATKDDKMTFKRFENDGHFLELNMLKKSLQVLEDIDKSEELSIYYFKVYSDKLELFNKVNLNFIEAFKNEVTSYKNELKNNLIILILIAVISIFVFSIFMYLLYIRIIKSIYNFHSGVTSFFDYLNNKKGDVEFLDESSSDEFSHVSKRINLNIVSTKYKVDEDKKILAEAIMILKDFDQGKLYRRLNIDINNPLLLKLKDILNKMANNLEKTILELEKTNGELELSLTNLKKTQNQLIESEKMASLGGLVAGVAHEINTPIGIGITGSTHFLEMTNKLKKLYNDDEMGEDDFEDYLNSSVDLAKLININLSKATELIKSFKQIAVDQTSEEKRTFNLKQYLNEVLLSIGNVLKKTNLSVDIVCKPNIEIYFYPGLLSQIISNLIMNSIIHAYDKESTGKIILNAKVEEDNLTILYSDDGNGISSENLPKIFNPFFTTNRENGGSGLGLNIIYNIVTKQLNGTIKCKSNKSVGTEFLMIFKYK